MSAVRKFIDSVKDAVRRAGEILRAAIKRFQKREPKPIKVPYKLGTEIILMDEGRPMAHLVLVEIKHERYGGASANFMDRSVFLTARSFL